MPQHFSTDIMPRAEKIKEVAATLPHIAVPGAAVRHRARRRTNSGNWSGDAPPKAAVPASHTPACPHPVWDKTRHQQDNKARANAAAARQAPTASRRPTDEPPAATLPGRTG